MSQNISVTNILQLSFRHARALLCLWILGLTMTVAVPAHTAVKTKPYAEFVKALNIVEQTQLTLFTDTLPPNKEETIKIYEARVSEAETKLDKDAPDYAKQSDTIRIEIMRTLLSETIEQYNDVGLKFRAIKDDYPVAIGALTGGPMENANIQPGDTLISVDDTTLFELSSSEIVKALKGPADSVATLLISRDNVEHTLKVNRTSVELHYADSELLKNNIGLIKVSRFGSNTHVRVGKMLDDLISQGAQSFILDLRDNPGGSTRAARAIVSMFSTEKDVYREKYKSGAVKQLPRHGEHKTDLPLAVLINGDSMSSSEIVAGAIQSYNRGIIIGSPSFGKGLVQKVFNLQAPLGGAVRTTIAVFGRPDHQIIHAAGIVPDVYVKTKSDFMFRRTGSLNISAQARAFQRTLLEKDVKAKHPDKAEEFIAANDLQLQTAVNRLEGIINNAQ